MSTPEKEVKVVDKLDRLLDHKSVFLEVIDVFGQNYNKE